jgi:hypothetical protein
MDSNEGVKPEFDANILGMGETENLNYAVESIEKLLTQEPETPAEIPVATQPESSQEPEPSFTYTPPFPPGIPDYVVQDNVIITQALEDMERRMAEHERSPLRNSTDPKIKGAWSAAKWDLVDEKVKLEQTHQNIFNLTMQAIKPVMDQHQQAQRQQQTEVQAAWDAEMKSIIPDFGESTANEIVTYLRNKVDANGNRMIPDERIAAYTPTEAAAFYEQMKGGNSVKPVQRIPLRQKVQPMDAEQQKQQRMEEAERQIRRANLHPNSIEANAMRLQASGYIDQEMPASQMNKTYRNKAAPELSIDALKNRLRQTGKVDDAAEIFYRTLFGGQ